jgi:hypothetical protein
MFSIKKIWRSFQNNRQFSTEYSFSELLFFVVSENSPPQKKRKRTGQNPDDEKGCHHHNRLVTSKEKLTCYLKERNPSIIIRQKMDRQIRIAARLTKERVRVKAVFKMISSHRRRSMMGHSFQ